MTRSNGNFMTPQHWRFVKWEGAVLKVDVLERDPKTATVLVRFREGPADGQVQSLPEEALYIEQADAQEHLAKAFSKLATSLDEAASKNR